MPDDLIVPPTPSGPPGGVLGPPPLAGGSAQGGFSFTAIVAALQTIGKALYSIQQVINNSFTQLAGNNTFTGSNTFTKPPLINAGAVGTATLLPEGELSKQSSAAGIGNGADTTDDTLFTYTLPANSLDIANRAIRVRAFGKFAANGNNKTVKIFFGASVVFSTGVVTTNNGGWFMELVLLKTAASTQIASGTGATGSANIAIPLSIAGSETDTAGIVIKVTGASPTTGAASDVVGNGFLVGYMN